MMIHYAMDALFFIMLVVCLIQPSAQKVFAAITFAGITSLHDLGFSDYDGLLYFVSAGVCDLAIIILVSGIRPIPRVALVLIKISLVSIVANFFGWVAWVLYYPPLAYEVSFMLIYSFAVVTLLRKGSDEDDMGGFTMDCWRSCIRGYTSTWVSHFKKGQGDI